MLGRFPFKTLEKYPHMKPEDVAVWERYIKINPGIFDSVDYDVGLGVGTPLEKEQSEKMQADWLALTRKKIDVIAYGLDGKRYLIEVKPIANMRALGQILTYEELYTRNNAGLIAKSLVIAGKVDRELAVMFDKHQIEVAIV